MSLYPLFPGTNELDQIEKIHNISGTPVPEVLAKMKRHSNQQHIDFNFPQKEGSGVEKLVPHVSHECCDLLNKLLAYNPDERISARQALKHPYFRDLREKEKWMQKQSDKSSDSAASHVRYNRVMFGASSSTHNTDDDDDLPSVRLKRKGKKKQTHAGRIANPHAIESEASDKHLPSIRKRKGARDREEHDGVHHGGQTHGDHLYSQLRHQDTGGIPKYDKYGHGHTHRHEHKHEHGFLHKEDSLASISSELHVGDAPERESSFTSALPPIGPSLSMQSISGKAVVKSYHQKQKERTGQSLYQRHLQNKTNLEKATRANYNFPSGRGSYGHSQAYTRIKHHHKRKAKEKDSGLQITGRVKETTSSFSNFQHQSKGGLSHANVKYISPYSRRALAQAH